VTGNSIGEGSFSGEWYNFITIKYDNEGNEIWFRDYDGTRSGFAEAWAACVDGKGNVCVAGESEGIGIHQFWVTTIVGYHLRKSRFCDKIIRTNVTYCNFEVTVCNFASSLSKMFLMAPA